MTRLDAPDPQEPDFEPSFYISMITTCTSLTCVTTLLQNLSKAKSMLNKQVPTSTYSLLILSSIELCINLHFSFIWEHNCGKLQGNLQPWLMLLLLVRSEVKSTVTLR